MKATSRQWEKWRLSVSQTQHSCERRVCNINKFVVETRPKRVIPKGSAGAENAQLPLAKFSIGASRRAETFNVLGT